MNTEKLLKETLAGIAEAEDEMHRWVTILRASDMSQKDIHVVCREAMSAWKTKYDVLMGQLSYLTNATTLALH